MLNGIVALKKAAAEVTTKGFYTPFLSDSDRDLLMDPPSLSHTLPQAP